MAGHSKGSGQKPQGIYIPGQQVPGPAGTGGAQLRPEHVQKELQSISAASKRLEQRLRETQGALETADSTLESRIGTNEDDISNLQSIRRVSVIGFGAVGDDSTDDSVAFQSAIDYCVANTSGNSVYSLHIPKGNYILQSQLTIDGGIGITCDARAFIKFPNASSCGFVFTNSDGQGQVYSVELPMISGPAYGTGFTLPGYPSSWSPTSLVGTGILIEGVNRASFKMHGVNGWDIGVDVRSRTGRLCANLDIYTNTSDLCNKTFSIGDGGSTNGIIHNRIIVGTAMCKHVFYIGDSTNVHTNEFGVSHTAIVNQPEGCAVYAKGNSVTDNQFYINGLICGYSSDSPTGTDVNLRSPYIAGNGSLFGNTYDAEPQNALGYFDGSGNYFNLGLTADSPYGTAGADPAPDPANWAGVRFRVAGYNNTIHLPNLRPHVDHNAANYTQVSAVSGEANFNGGVGGALVAQTVPLKMDLNITPGAANVGYVYHSLQSTWSSELRVADVAGDLAANNIELIAVFFVGVLTPREIQIIARNRGSSTFTGTVKFLLSVGA